MSHCFNYFKLIVTRISRLNPSDQQNETKKNLNNFETVIFSESGNQAFRTPPRHHRGPKCGFVKWPKPLWHFFTLFEVIDFFIRFCWTTSLRIVTHVKDR